MCQERTLCLSIQAAKFNKPLHTHCSAAMCALCCRYCNHILRRFLRNAINFNDIIPKNLKM
ncbi:hypothetical protein C1Y43_08725 [Pantoea sp. ICBG 828]|nr:hypothetical protein C1Y43_08725 [Pantoea sp. ICBG 828]